MKKAEPYKQKVLCGAPDNLKNKYGKIREEYLKKVIDILKSAVEEEKMVYKEKKTAYDGVIESLGNPMQLDGQKADALVKIQELDCLEAMIGG